MARLTAQDPIALATIVAGIVADMKGEDLRVLDLRGLTSFTDCFVICSGQSNRQVQAIAEEVQLRLKAQGLLPLGLEGAAAGQWVLIDYGSVVVHVFYPETRVHYQIEKMWADAPDVAWNAPPATLSPVETKVRKRKAKGA